MPDCTIFFSVKIRKPPDSSVTVYFDCVLFKYLLWFLKQLKSVSLKFQASKVTSMLLFDILYEMHCTLHALQTLQFRSVEKYLICPTGKKALCLSPSNSPKHKQTFQLVYFHLFSSSSLDACFFVCALVILLPSFKFLLLIPLNAIGTVTDIKIWIVFHFIF